MKKNDKWFSVSIDKSSEFINSFKKIYQLEKELLKHFTEKQWNQYQLSSAVGAILGSRPLVFSALDIYLGGALSHFDDITKGNELSLTIAIDRVMSGQEFTCESLNQWSQDYSEIINNTLRGVSLPSFICLIKNRKVNPEILNTYDILVKLNGHYKNSLPSRYIRKDASHSYLRRGICSFYLSRAIHYKDMEEVDFSPKNDKVFNSFENIY